MSTTAGLLYTDPLRRVSCRPMTPHPSRTHTLKTSSARPTPGSIPLFVLSQEAPLCSASPPSFARQDFPPVCDFSFHITLPVTVLAFYFGRATWVQSSHPASPRPSFVSGANLMLTHRLLSSLPLYAAVRQFWCHGRWYERSDLWV